MEKRSEPEVQSAEAAEVMCAPLLKMLKGQDEDAVQVALEDVGTALAAFGARATFTGMVAIAQLLSQTMDEVLKEAAKKIAPVPQDAEHAGAKGEDAPDEA